MITAAQLKGVMPDTDRAEDFAGPLSAACERFHITLPKRIPPFLAQIAHESGSLKHLSENLDYGADGLCRTWPNRFNAEQSLECARQPEKIANRVYCDRMGNGSEASGDGWRYRGRGLIQLTGRDNYARCGIAIGLDLLAHPDLLEQPEGASLSAAWFWSTHGCNELADAGDFTGITKKINGGTNGLDERQRFFRRAQQVFAGG